MEKILIVDDDDAIRKQLRWGLDSLYEVIVAADRREALALAMRHKPRVMTLDLGLPPDAGGSTEGFRCLQEVLERHPATKVIVLTGNDAREAAVRAVSMGAYDFCNKPIDLAELQVILKRAFYLAAIEEENESLHDVIDRQEGFFGLLGCCSAMEGVFATIRKVASSDVPILVTGESGTGKELVARALRSLSGRKSGPFIPINSGAIPENLLEAELFGYEKGAFTGAHSRVQGKVEYAHGGTLFLDEIGELPLALQVKLLRFLQEKVTQRVGGREDIAVDARIVSATNRDLVAAIREGKFREDLYYRISVITITLPPLRERGGDIMLLANLFLRKFAGHFKKKVKGFSDATVAAMERYNWPGNVRELENRVQRAVLMSDSPLISPVALGLNDDAAGAQPSVVPVTLREARDRVEKEMLAQAMRRGSSVGMAAQLLGVSRPTLYDLMRKHGIEGLG